MPLIISFDQENLPARIWSAGLFTFARVSAVRSELHMLSWSQRGLLTTGYSIETNFCD